MDTNNNSSFKKYYDANSFTVNGRLTKDPEVRVAPSGNSYAIISIANNRGDNTNFFTFFASAAQIPFVQSSLKKGCAVDVTGTILPQVETGPDGKNTTNYKLIANKFALVANPKGATGNQTNTTAERPMQSVPQQNYSQNQYQQQGGYPQQQFNTPQQTQPNYGNQQPQYQQNNFVPPASVPNTFNSDDDLPF